MLEFKNAAATATASGSDSTPMETPLHVPASDESGDIVKTRFIHFLNTFGSEFDQENIENEEENRNNRDHM